MQNYFSGSQSIKMALKGHHKFEYLIEEVSRPRPGDPQKRIWKGEDSFPRPMLINSMETSNWEPFLYDATAQNLWDSIQKLYLRARMCLAFILCTSTFTSATRGQWISLHI